MSKVVVWICMVPFVLGVCIIILAAAPRQGHGYLLGAKIVTHINLIVHVVVWCFVFIVHVVAWRFVFIIAQLPHPFIYKISIRNIFPHHTFIFFFKEHLIILSLGFIKFIQK